MPKMNLKNNFFFNIFFINIIYKSPPVHIVLKIACMSVFHLMIYYAYTTQANPSDYVLLYVRIKTEYISFFIFRGHSAPC